MTISIQQPELQQRTLQLYGELLCRRSEWGGQLVAAAFAGAAGSGLAAAASLAGAASLTVDADAAAMKAHFRDGAYDFVVNTLDEALRALKNEIRRRRSIAIGLIATPEAVLSEAADRGVSARMVLVESSQPAPLEEAMSHQTGFIVSAVQPSTQFVAWLAREHWFPVLSEQPPRDVDLKDDDPRRRWLRNLTTYQRSASRSERWVWLSKDA